MSINFYSTMDRNTLIAHLGLPYIMKYSADHSLQHSSNGTSDVFTMNWKTFNDMIKSVTPTEKRNMNLNFIELKNSPQHIITLTVPMQGKNLVLTQDSLLNNITPEIAHITDDALVTIQFDAVQNSSVSNPTKINVPNTGDVNTITASPELYRTKEGFSSCKKLTTFDYLLFAAGLVLIIYLIYHLYFKKTTIKF